MNYQTKEISKNTFQTFINKTSLTKTFHQSVNFGDFREAIREQIFYTGIYKNNDLIGVALIQKITTRVKTYLHCPHGPILDSTETDAWQNFLSFYKNFGTKQKADFVRISPLLSKDTNAQPIFKKLNYRNAPIHLVNPEHTLILDITPNEEDLLKNMRKSTRYEVRRIEKMGITVQTGTDEQNFENFWQLHHETVKRQGFTPFPKSHTQKELQIFEPNIEIFTAQIDGKSFSSSVIIFDNKSAYYHQGASIYSKAPVAHATIWAAIKEAKRRGCIEFNFWGIVDKNQTKHPWFGLSRFKKGFGGKEHKYLHCQDFPLTWKYYLSAAIEKFRKWKRGY
ncbi:hypothetical protein CSB37_00180 [bacterium DOLZORAL124_38_8]|nr:MAG: hypothetical protein CSB37_00180 [bacterium DOLZORAL124_38_8]